MITYTVTSSTVVKDNVFMNYETSSNYLGDIKVSLIWLNAVGSIVLITFTKVYSFLGIKLRSIETQYLMSNREWYYPSIDKKGNKSLKSVPHKIAKKLNKSFLLYRIVSDE